MLERLQQEMYRLGMNPRSLAERANLGQSFVYDLLSGKSSNPTTNKLSAIANALGVSLPYLISGSTNDNITYGKDENFIVVPVISDTEESNTMLYKQFLFHKNWLAENGHGKTTKLKIANIIDNSMQPLLSNNDTVMVDTSSKIPVKPGIFLIKSGTCMLAKHLEFAPDKNFRTVFISHEMNSYTYSCDIEDIEIIGRIVWVARKI